MTIARGTTFNTTTGVTLLPVRWKPYRYPVHWVSDWAEIPLWDVSLGNNASGWAHRFNLEQLEALPAEEQETEKAWMRMRNSTVTPRLDNEFRHPPGYETDQAPLPRLVRTWGESDAFYSIPTMYPYVGSGNGGEERYPDWLVGSTDRILRKWAKRPAFFADIASLAKFFKKKAYQDGLMDEIVKIVKKQSLLFPTRGDTLRNWGEAILEFSFWQQIRRILQEEKDNKMYIIKKDNLFHKAITAVARKYPYLQSGDDYDIESFLDLFEGRFFHHFPNPQGGLTIDEFQSHIARALRSNFKGSIEANQLGFWVVAGGLEWARLELAEAILQGTKLCVICGEVLEGRGGKKVRANKRVCDERRCQQQDYRQRKRATPVPHPPPESNLP
jgi:hypothetical protein